MLEWLFEYRANFQYAAILLLFLASLRWGDAPERLSTGILLAMPVGEIFYHKLFGVGLFLAHVDLGHFIMSLGSAAGYLAIALYANRRYPIWLVAFQLISVLTHLVHDLSGTAAAAAYQILAIAPSYCMMLVLLIGLGAHRRRMRRHGPYRPWRTSSPRSRGPQPTITLDG